MPPGRRRIIAADGGLDHARAAGLDPDVLVGDLDSISADRAGAGRREHTEVVRHPVDKAATDTELAIAHAADAARRQRILLVAGAGDRLDHAIAALGALGAPELAGVAALEAWWGSDQLHVVHAPGAGRARPAAPGTTFSVLAMHGPCRGVTVERRPLAARPTPTSRRSSASACQQRGRRRRRSPVGVADGIVTVIVPGARP